MTPEDLAAGGDEDGVREGAGPLGVDGLSHGVGVAAGPVIVVRLAAFVLDGLGGRGRQGSVAGFEEFRDSGAEIGGIEADGNELNGAVLEAAVGVHEIGELFHTRTAGGGPKIDEPDVLGSVRTQLFRVLLVKIGDGDGALLPSGLVSGDVVFLKQPFGGAAEGAGDGLLHLGAGEDGIEGIAEVALVDSAGIAAAVVHAAGVAEFPLCIEKEDVGRGLCAAGGGEGLGLTVVKVGEGPAVVLGEGCHFLLGIAEGRIAELVGREAGGVVAIDGDEGDALALVVLINRLGPRGGGDGIGAMVAGEDDAERLGVLKVGEGVGLAIGAGQREIRRACADGEHFRHFLTKQRQYQRGGQSQE